MFQNLNDKHIFSAAKFFINIFLLYLMFITLDQISDTKTQEKKIEIIIYPACLASSLDINEKISATTGFVFCRYNTKTQH